jgi:hypothetical protein
VSLRFPNCFGAILILLKWKQVLLRFVCCYFPFIIVILAIYLFNKDSFCFINGNLTLKNLVKQESFQHYYVFVTLLIMSLSSVNIYINLASEVRVKSLKQINLNKSMKTIYKSCYFITVTAFSILAQNTVMELFLTSFRTANSRRKCKYTGNSKWSFDRF